MLTTVPPLRRRGALVADDQTKEDMRRAVENAALAGTGIVRMKKKAASVSEKRTQKEDIEVSPEEEVGKHPLIMKTDVV